MQTKFLGLIAGNGKFPILFAQEAKRKNYKIIAAGIQGDTSSLLRFFVDEFRMFKVGQLKKLFFFFKEKGIEQVIMAGQVDPNHLFESSVILDDEFQKLFEAMKDRKADTIFSTVAGKLKQEGIELMDSTFLLQDYLAPKGTLTRRAPEINELEDIEFGRNIAKLMGAIDVGQTVVIKDKAIVAIEAMEGTDRTIMRGGRISKSGAVVVKMSKPAQDLRFDVPVVGPRTICSMIKVKAKCLAIEAGKTILIDRDAICRLADKSKICVVAV